MGQCFETLECGLFRDGVQATHPRHFVAATDVLAGEARSTKPTTAFMLIGPFGRLPAPTRALTSARETLAIVAANKTPVMFVHGLDEIGDHLTKFAAKLDSKPILIGYYSLVVDSGAAQLIEDSFAWLDKHGLHWGRSASLRWFGVFRRGG